MNCQYSRRKFLGGMAASVSLPALACGAARPFANAAAPTSPVAIAKCKTYGPELVATLGRMFDQLGGLGKLVKGKTVAIKMNMTGSVNYRLGYKPAELTHYTHPAVIGAAVHWMGRAGAKRIRILECPWATAEPLEEVMLQANWDPNIILNAAPNVEMENTNWLGSGKKYSRFAVPGGGWIYPAYDLNHSFEDCDVFVSIAKAKEHATAGITLSMKNHFGSAPCTIYGSGDHKDGPLQFPRGGRDLFHTGRRQPATIKEKDPSTSRAQGWRVPRIVTELCAARPIHLAINEAIETMDRGEGPWIQGGKHIAPGFIVAGFNPVCTDAITTAVMGFDPMADRGAKPFERCDSTLRLGEELGLGTRDPKRIEVVGVPINQAIYKFRA